MDPGPATEGAARSSPRWTDPFAVRGRWDDPRDISWRAEPPDAGTRDGPPADPEPFVEALRRAAAAWNATGVVVLRQARPGERADVTFGWRRGSHDDCPPFGRSPSVAHSGPVAPGSFVHFDAGRLWDLGDAGEPRGDEGRRPVESLAQVAAHEWGHVLGLDHVSDPSALMSPDARVARPGAGDIAGLHSLYGGGVDGAGDVRLGSSAGACTLRRIAPPDRTRVDLFDTDGDGTSELLVLRTDDAGMGALTIYRFEAGPTLVGTAGPWPGIAPPGLVTTFCVAGDGGRWIVTRAPDGELLRLRRFDERGRLVEPSPVEVMALDLEVLIDGRTQRGDADGDGEPEELRRSC